MQPPATQSTEQSPEQSRGQASEQASPHMRRALALGWSALGSTSPNPAVGCVVVARDGAIAGEGCTQPPGGNHAEAEALAQAGARAKGATMYVTLEPCNHHGRTPPCADAVIAAGVAEVRVATRDPNPNVAGGGIARLEAAGIRARLGDGRREARRLIEGFVKHSNTGMPFVTVKFAMSLDGKIASRSGDSKWISGPESRQYSHSLRARSDAIMVGINTALADDPQLTARDAAGNAAERQPMRVVLDSRGRLPADARMLSAPGKTLVAVTQGAARLARDRLAGDRVETLALPPGEGGVDLRALLALLDERGIVNILVEGGGGVLGTLFDMRLVDKVVAFVAPVIIGGSDAASPVGGLGAETIRESARLRDVTTRRFGADVAIIGYCGSDNDVHRNS